MATKTLDDVQADMSLLYEELRSGAVETKTAAELANIAGKYLKVEQLKLAREIFVSSQGRLVHNQETAAHLTLARE